MSTFAIVAGLSKHGDKTALARAATGLLILIFGAAVRHDTLDENGESGERMEREWRTIDHSGRFAFGDNQPFKKLTVVPVSSSIV
jgi:hypothetical protein